MKSGVLVFLFVLGYVQCGRKTYQPIDKNANLAFINMEGGGGSKPGGNTKPVVTPIQAPAVPGPQPTPPRPTTARTPVIPPTQPKPTPAKPNTAGKPVLPPTQPNPTQAPVRPVQPPQTNQIHQKPANPTPVGNPGSTPGPGSVKQLINFYDSQGKASPIRPYSYSQSVKQG